MFNFLKICGMGLLAILLSPLWIGLLAIAAVFGLLLFIFMLIRMLCLDLHNFFVKDKSKVKDPFGDLPEDLEVKRLLKAQEAVVLSQEQATISTSVPAEQTIVVEEKNTYIENTVPFVPVEEKKEELEEKVEETNSIEQKEDSLSSTAKEGDEQ